MKMKFFIKIQKVFIFILLIFLAIFNEGCGVKTLRHASETPRLHDGYEVETNKRLYVILPVPAGMDKDNIRFYVSKVPVKGDFWLADNTAGFAYYTPKSGMYGYDYMIYTVSDGKTKFLKKIQFNIED